MLQILPSILTPHSLTFLSNFPFEGSRGNDSFLIERRHTHVKDLKHVWHESQHGWNLSHMCYHTSSMWSYNPLVCIIICWFNLHHRPPGILDRSHVFYVHCMGIKKVYTEVFKYFNLVWHVFVGLETTVKQIEKDKKKNKTSQTFHCDQKLISYFNHK